jgi:hypothetical protein
MEKFRKTQANNLFFVMDYPDCVKSSLEERILAGSYEAVPLVTEKPKKKTEEFIIPDDE